MKFWFRRGIWTSKRARKIISELVPEDIKSIAIIRHGALGDMVLIRAFIVEARKAFPNAKITLSIVSNYTRGAPHDLVDRVHTMIGSDQPQASLRERINSLIELDDHDLIFDLSSTPRTYMLCIFNRAKLKIGYPYRFLQAKLFLDIAIPRSDLDFQVCNFLKMLNAFGIKTAYPHEYNMPGEPVKRDRPYVVYFTGASTQDKCWPVDRFSALIEKMTVNFPGHDHLVLEGLNSWEKAGVILDRIDNRDNTGSLTSDTVEDTISILKGADLLVSNDTGIRHLAIVSDTPTVGIFYFDPFRYWPRYPIHDVVFDDNGHPDVISVYNACLGLMNGK